MYFGLNYNGKARSSKDHVASSRFIKNLKCERCLRGCRCCLSKYIIIIVFYRIWLRISLGNWFDPSKVLFEVAISLEPKGELLPLKGFKS